MPLRQPKTEPVEIVALRVEWMLTYGNMPEIQVLLSRVPDMSEFRFKTKPVSNNNMLIWGELDGIVMFNAIDSHDKRGYGGIEFTYTLEDGTPFMAKGPWSSSPSTMNLHFPHVVDVSTAADPATWYKRYGSPRQRRHFRHRGQCFLHGIYIRVEKLRAAMEKLSPELSLEAVPFLGSTIYTPHSHFASNCRKGADCIVCNEQHYCRTSGPVSSDIGGEQSQAVIS